MNLSTAKLLFQIRLYQWAKLRAAQELDDEFPHFWLFKGGLSWQFYHFIKELPRADQDLLISAKLKRRHSDAAKELGETTSKAEKAIADRYTKFVMKHSPMENEVDRRRRMRDPMKFTSNRKIRRAMLASFQKAFANFQPSEPHHVNLEWSTVSIRHSGWMIQTGFGFGRSQSVLNHSHTIYSEDMVPHPKLPGVGTAALVLTHSLYWIGLSTMEWEYLTDSDVEPACNIVIELCHEFFDQCPKLLEGLSRENILSE